MTQYQITVRYGGGAHRYHVFSVEANGVVDALARAARQIPEHVASDADLVEVREAVAPEARPAGP